MVTTSLEILSELAECLLEKTLNNKIRCLKHYQSWMNYLNNSDSDDELFIVIDIIRYFVHYHRNKMKVERK